MRLAVVYLLVALAVAGAVWLILSPLPEGSCTARLCGPLVPPKMVVV